MAGNEQSRRDDIESIGYMIIFFMKKKLPWQGIKGNSYKECYHKLYLMKKHMDLELLCRGLPGEIVEYMKYAKSLAFEQEPNYKYLKNLFQTILNKKKISIDKYVLSWCMKDDNINLNNDNKPINNNNVGNKKDNANNKSKNKSSNSNIFYKKVKENLETEIKSPNNLNLTINKSNKNFANNNMNSMNDKNELNSEVSNTLKVLMSKNLQSINNSGQNQSAGINLNFARINSEKNIYSDNFFIQAMNNNTKGYIAPIYKNGIIMSLNHQLTERNNYNNTDKIHNYPSYYDDSLNKTNKIMKISSISPLQNNKGNNIQNNILININNNINKINKITHIKIADMSHNNSNNFSKINNSNNNNKENIIYNTYNTYNTYNSYNNISNSTNNPNNSYNNPINTLYKRDPPQIINYQNYNRIKKNNIQNNTLLNYIKSESFIEDNKNQLNNTLRKNKSFINDKYTSIEVNKKDKSITGYFSYKNNQNQKDLNSYNNINNIRKSNTGLNKNKIISITPVYEGNKNMDKNNNNTNNNSKIQHYNSYIINNNNNYSNYNNTNNISIGKNNFLKITKHSNKKSFQNNNQKNANYNIENRSMNIINSTRTGKNFTNNKVYQNNQKNNKTLENKSYYINNNRYGISSSYNHNDNKSKKEINQVQNKKNIRNIVNIDNKNRRNNKLIFSKMEPSPPNHSLKIIKTSSRKNKIQENIIKENNTINLSKKSRINKYKIVRNRNPQNH